MVSQVWVQLLLLAGIPQHGLSRCIQCKSPICRHEEFTEEGCCKIRITWRCLCEWQAIAAPITTFNSLTLAADCRCNGAARSTSYTWIRHFWDQKLACVSAGWNEIESFHMALETTLHILWWFCTRVLWCQWLHLVKSYACIDTCSRSMVLACTETYTCTARLYAWHDNMQPAHHKVSYPT